MFALLGFAWLCCLYSLGPLPEQRPVLRPLQSRLCLRPRPGQQLLVLQLHPRLHHQRLRRSVSRLSVRHLRKHRPGSVRIHGAAQQAVGHQGRRFNGEPNFSTCTRSYHYRCGSHPDGDYCMPCPPMCLTGLCTDLGSSLPFSLSFSPLALPSLSLSPSPPPLFLSPALSHPHSLIHTFSHSHFLSPTPPPFFPPISPAPQTFQTPTQELCHILTRGYFSTSRK
jgi:hypothetical protein